MPSHLHRRLQLLDHFPLNVSRALSHIVFLVKINKYCLPTLTLDRPINVNGNVVEIIPSVHV